ncbi:hypothetical protein [Burkholderia pseudomallei]|uniref:hypothetical protein n=1 Tax=Burkholderia pseudomallei TaxID=28450 RepID=UPI000F24D303|nr:hypothetical protein [Burkholderia pseudomallei]CAJ3224516.1 Uncharacterised protein [Burkholderia pseudomallei]CAJ4959174.1 Uncharacterised protein [Burkholderia pseudomallei]CAJ6499521.1 Uncharacterised protein [Burkholderia pseudomallei]CAJ7095652.1 Uncharacterised protein [Burkholderia pseudomallei]VBH69897.1 Uncharacterised protein [Burkholderia pseudomallei]
MHHSFDKRLIRFENIEEIRIRPAFRDEIAAASALPKEAVGVYRFPKDAPEQCGLSNCRTPHMKGFVVAMESGEETLVGGYCGAKKMGLAFQEVINRAQLADRMQRYRDTISAAVGRADEFDTRLADLLERPRGAKWIAKRIANCNATLPSEVNYLIRRMAQRQEPDVFDAVPMTEKEIAIARETGAIPKGQPGPYFRQEKVGIIVGLEIWRTDLRPLLIDDLQQGMRALKALDVALIRSEHTLRKHAQWVDEIQRKFSDAERLIVAGQEFFDAANLRLLKRLSTAEREVKGLAGAVDNLILQTTASL